MPVAISETESSKDGHKHLMIVFYALISMMMMMMVLLLLLLLGVNFLGFFDLNRQRPLRQRSSQRVPLTMQDNVQEESDTYTGGVTPTFYFRSRHASMELWRLRIDGKKSRKNERYSITRVTIAKSFGMSGGKKTRPLPKISGRVEWMEACRLVVSIAEAKKRIRKT